MKRELTCIVCPLGCSLTVEVDNGKVLSVSGNTCPRGEVYAKSECVNPMRVLTTTVKCENGKMLSVKTDRAIPKEKLFEAMQIVNGVIARLPICAGDVIIENVFGANVVATQNLG